MELWKYSRVTCNNALGVKSDCCRVLRRRKIIVNSTEWVNSFCSHKTTDEATSKSWLKCMCSTCCHNQLIIHGAFFVLHWWAWSLQVGYQSKAVHASHSFFRLCSALHFGRLNYPPTRITPSYRNRTQTVTYICFHLVSKYFKLGVTKLLLSLLLSMPLI